MGPIWASAWAAGLCVYAAQSVESTCFRLTRGFRLAYTRLSTILRSSWLAQGSRPWICGSQDEIPSAET